jgi:hypothetical protein
MTAYIRGLVQSLRIKSGEVELVLEVQIERIWTSESINFKIYISSGKGMNRSNGMNEKPIVIAFNFI